VVGDINVLFEVILFCGVISCFAQNQATNKAIQAHFRNEAHQYSNSQKNRCHSPVNGRISFCISFIPFMLWWVPCLFPMPTAWLPPSSSLTFIPYLLNQPLNDL